MMIVYRREFDETKQMVFFIKDDELLEKQNNVSENVIKNASKHQKWT